MMALPSIPDWASRSLQGLAYWLGSQSTIGLAANLSEGAIAWEFSRLLHLHRDDRRILESEVYYRHIPELNVAGALDEANDRADLVIVRRKRKDRTVSYHKGDVEAIIEIKHNRSQKRLLWKDIDFLGQQRTVTRTVRAFLIYASVDERPSEFTQANGRAIKPRNQLTPKDETSYRIRRVCRATQVVPEDNDTARGHYALLLEVAP